MADKSQPGAAEGHKERAYSHKTQARQVRRGSPRRRRQDNRLSGQKIYK